MEMYKLKQVSIRLVEEVPILSLEPVSSPKEAARILAKWFESYDREVLTVVNLQADLRPINYTQVSIGDLSESLAHPREIFKAAILSNAASILLLHNHPSGSLKPSAEDRRITERIQQAGELMGIHLLDHIILGKNGDFFSIVQEEKNRVREDA